MTTAVTGIAISALPSATLPLDGTEMVPLVQNSVTKQTPASALAAVQADMPQATVKGRQLAGGVGPPLNLTQAELTALVTGLVNAQLAQMAQATIKGRALAAGLGTPTDLSATQAADIVWSEFGEARRGSNDVGFLTLPSTALGSVTFTLEDTDAGNFYYVEADDLEIDVPDDGSDDLGNGFIVSVGVANAGGSVSIFFGPGVTIRDLVTGDEGDFEIVGFGSASLWKVGPDLWFINGTNVAVI